MPPISSDALVLRAYKLGETSKVVVLLTRERGKLRAVAKGARGARPRYQSSLEPLSEVRVGLYGRQGAELYRLGECELVRSAFRAGARGLEAALALSYFAELIDAFAQEGEAEDAVYRLALAVVAAAEEGTDPGVLARYLEAWLLKLGGIYPPLDRCAGCAGPLEPGAERRYHHPAHGFVCDGCGGASGPVLGTSDHDFLREVFTRGPSVLVRRPSPTLLESFHRDLIREHLERDLRSHRVLRDVAREMRG
ncbi:MAG TPA: DNA repair protein RecO [Vicinamibacteria bacterium]|nr:DNA repair protein RecO [Vicinamibacteria bacterium]